MNPIYLNCTGLTLGMLGTFMIWKFGLPLDISRTGAQHLALEQPDEKEAALARKYDRLSSIGFLLLFIGFALQLFAQFC